MYLNGTSFREHSPADFSMHITLQEHESHSFEWLSADELLRLVGRVRGLNEPLLDKLTGGLLHVLQLERFSDYQLGLLPHAFRKQVCSALLCSRPLHN